MLAAIFTLGCSSDDDPAKKEESKAKGMATYDGQEIQLEFGLLQQPFTTVGDASHSTELMLYSTGFTTTEINGIPKVTGGVGSLFSVTFNSTAVKDLPSGKYVYDINSYNTPSQCQDGSLNVKIDYTSVAGNDPNAYVEFSNGSVTVDKKGEAYVLTFELHTAKQNVFTGSYSGALLWLP